MRFGFKTFFAVTFIVGIIFFPLHESMAKHVKNYEVSIPEDKSSLAAYNYMVCLMTFNKKILRKYSYKTTKNFTDFSPSRSSITTSRIRKFIKCIKKPESFFNSFSKEFLEGMDAVAISFMYIDRDFIQHKLFYSKERSEGIVPAEYKNTKITFSKFGTIATPYPGNVYIMPDGQEMVFTKDNKWVPCSYVSSQCVPDTK